MAPLRASFLGGSSFGALMAADGVVGGGTGEAAPGQTTQSESAGPAAASSADSAAGASSGAPAAATPAPDTSAAPAAPEGAAPAKPESATSLLAEAKAKPPGEAEAAKPDAKPEGDKPADKPAPDKPKTEETAPAKDAAKPEGEAAPVKEAPAEKPPAQTYEAFKLPEGITLDADKTKSFTSILDNPEFKPQDRAQALIDMHLSEVTRIQKEAAEHQQTVWKQFQQANVDEVRKDPEYGGNRIETSLGRAKWVIEQYGGTPEQQAALLAEHSYTGMGNSVRMVRLLNNIADVLSEGEVVPAAPVAARTTQSRREKFYPSMQGANGKTA